MTKEGQQILNKLLPQLSKIDQRISVEGHTDRSSPQGNYNHIELSALRAKKVKDFLIKFAGMKKDMVFTAAYGSSRPVASNRSMTGRLENSRVEIKLIYQDEGIH